MATTQSDPNANRITLKGVRLSYVTLFEPKAGEINGVKTPPKYSCTVLLDEKTDAAQIKAVEAIIERLLTEKFGPKAKRSPKLNFPLRAGTEFPDKKGYGEGIRFINMSADVDHKPEVVDAIKGGDGKLVRLTKEDGRPYSGCYVNISANFYAFDKGVNKGVGVGLGNVQFVKHGERLGGGKSADQEFEEEEGAVTNLLD